MISIFFLRITGVWWDVYGWECIYRKVLGKALLVRIFWKEQDCGGGGIDMGKLYLSSRTDELEPIGTTILLEKESLAVGEAARSAAGALGRVGAVEIGYVLVADVAEPGE